VRTETLSSVSEVQGSYTIGCHPSVALFAAGGFLAELLEKYPKLDISLRHDISRRIAEDVISLKADIGIVVNPVQHPDLVIHPLCKDEFTLWTSGSGRETENLKSGNAVLVCDPELAQSQSLMRQLARNGIKFGRTVTSGNLEVIADLVAEGAGLGFLPVQAASRTKKKLKRVPKAPVFYDEHCLLFRVENKNVKSIQVINATIKAFYARK
jgi:DNA-binding transcriptional LysR family regulator